MPRDEVMSPLVNVMHGIVQSTRRRKGSLCIIAAACLSLIRFWRRWCTRPRGAVVAPGHWLLGHLPKFAAAAARCKHHELLFDLHRRLGQTYALKVFLQPWWLVTTNPNNVEHILKHNFDNYHKGSIFKEKLHELLGGGIFNVDGQEWYQQRKTASRMFTTSLFKEHIWVVVQRNARKLCSIVESVQCGDSVDMFNLFNRFTLDTIGEIGFGKCIGSLEDPSSPFLQSFDKAQQICMQRFYIPCWKLQRWFNAGFEKESHGHFSRLDDYSRSVVRELQRNMEKRSGKSSGVVWSDIESRKSFVGLFLEDAQKRGEKLDEDFLRDLVLNFLIAGRDTTAQALSWTIYCLCTNPSVEGKVRQEIEKVCGIRGPSYDDMNQLPYLHAVINETLRLYPSVPVDMKMAMQDDTLPDGVFVPRGTVLLYNMYSMGRDRSIWGEDAEVFRPERWLEMDAPPNNYAFAVFNAGPRECLGRRLAQVEMKACLAMLLPRFHFTLAVPKEDIITDRQLTIGMGRGLPCFIRDQFVRERKMSSSSTAFQSDVCEQSERSMPLSDEAAEGLASDDDVCP